MLLSILSSVLVFLSENSVVLCLVIVGLFIFLNRQFGFVLMETVQRSDHVYCSDGNCVRCNKYHSTALLALSKIPRIKDRVISFKVQKGLDFIHRSLDAKNKQKPNIFYYDNLLAQPVWHKKSPAGRIEDLVLIEQSFSDILEEYQFIYSNPHIGSWKRNSTPQGTWDVFHLINQGSVTASNQELCPRTTSVLRQLPSLMKNNVFGNVMFSVLSAGTVISPHYGPTNIRLRCHLGLDVPSTCLLKVDSETVQLETGQCLVFDDSFLHSVEFKATSDKKFQCSSHRAVLIIDFWHPDLSMEERQILDMCFSP